MPRTAVNDFTGPEAPPGYQLGQSGASLGPEATQTDARGRKFVVWPDGSKFFLRPEFMDISHAGGKIHKPDEWNPKTGEWEPQGVDWGKLGPWLGLAGIGGATAIAALSATAPAAVTTSVTSTAPAATGTVGSGAGTTAGVTAGTGGAAGVGGSTAALGPSTAANIAATTAAANAVPTGIAAGSTGGTVAGTAGVVGKLGGWGNLIGIGAQLGGQYMANRAASKATDKQIAASERAAELEAQSQREALDFAKAVYGREQEQLAPYVGAGGSAVTKLSQLMGLGTPAPYKPLPVQAPIPAAPGVMVGDPRLGPGPSNPAMAGSNTAPNGTLASLSGIGGSVLMQAPDGSQRQVPQAMVAEATAKGARVISNGLG